MLSEIDRLIALGLLDSAEALCLFYVSHLNSKDFKSDPAGIVLAETYERLGDALYQKKEVKRALHFFRTAGARRRSGQPSKHRPQFVVVANMEEATLRYKECKCLVDLKDNLVAIKDLESIPSKYRDSKIHLLLGDLYKRSNNKRNAIAAYKEVLAAAPHSIEVIEILVNLGVEAVDILPTLDEALRGQESHMTEGWLHSLVAGLIHKRNHEFEKSFTQFNRLSNSYPQNTYLLIQQAGLAVDMDLREQSMTLFKQVRKLDVHLGQRMEVFGKMLYVWENDSELSKLTDDVLDACPHLPTGWLLAAMYSAVKGEAEASLSFLDKVL